MRLTSQIERIAPPESNFACAGSAPLPLDRQGRREAADYHRGAGPSSLPTDLVTLLVVFGPVNLAAVKAPIKKVERCLRSGRPIGNPDNDSSKHNPTYRS